MTVETELEVSAPPAQVYRAAADLRAWERWFGRGFTSSGGRIVHQLGDLPQGVGAQLEMLFGDKAHVLVEVEEAREDLVPEKAFSEFNPDFAGTYFEEVHSQLATRFPIGRMRVLSKGLYNCNSWHRDPEPRLHIPIVTNPGSLFVVNHHVTHLPADGSVYFTDTRGYHTALNGGETRRVHIVAALAYPPVTS